MFESQEKPLDWAFFKDRHSRSSYQPKTNTSGLYDGSAEAREILNSARNTVTNCEPPISQQTWNAAGVLSNALDYLKGRDIQGFSYTQEFFTNLGDWVESMQEPQKPELLSIASVPEIAEDYPEWNPNHEPKTPIT